MKPFVSPCSNLVVPLLLLALPSSLVGEEAAASSPGRFSFSAGPLFRNFDGGSFRSGSRSQNVPRPGGPRFYTVSTGSAGEATGEALRIYDNGYVGPDTAGTTPGSLFENTTSRFGFVTDTQNRDNVLLEYTGQLTGSEAFFSSQQSNSPLSWDDDGDNETGIILEGDYRIGSPSEYLDILAQFSFLYSPLNIQGGGSSFEASRRDYRNTISGTLTDQYSIPNGVTLPQGPYTQPSESPPPGIYPRIMDEPTRTLTPVSTPAGSNSTRWFNDIREQVNADVYTFSLGPKVRFRVAEVGFLSASAGVSLNLVDWEASHEETLYSSRNGASSSTLQSWQDNSSSTDWIWGGFGQLSAGLMLGGGEEEAPRFLLQLFARWEQNERLSGQVGPSQFDLDLDSMSSGAMAGFFF